MLRLRLIEEIDLQEISSKVLKRYVKKAEKDQSKRDPDSDKARSRDSSLGLAYAKIKHQDSMKKTMVNWNKYVKTLQKEREKKKKPGYQNWPNQKKKAYYSLKEEAPTNAAGGGNIAGIGVGVDGEPGRPKRYQKKFRRRGVKNPFKNNRDILTFDDVVRRANR